MARISKTAKLLEMLEMERTVTDGKMQVCIQEEDFATAAIYKRHLDVARNMIAIINKK